MKIAFACEDNNGLDSTIARHFGRCPYYTFVTIENGKIVKVETKENPYFDSHEPGVVPNYIAKEGANVIIAGGMGQRAREWFEKLGIQAVTGAQGKVKDLLEEYLKNKLSK